MWLGVDGSLGVMNGLDLVISHFQPSTFIQNYK